MVYNVNFESVFSALLESCIFEKYFTTEKIMEWPSDFLEIMETSFCRCTDIRYRYINFGT